MKIHATDAGMMNHRPKRRRMPACSGTCAGAVTGSEAPTREEVPLVPQPSPPPAYTHPVFGTFLPPPPASVMLTFGSKSVGDFILNWCVSSAVGSAREAGALSLSRRRSWFRS